MVATPNSIFSNFIFVSPSHHDFGCDKWRLYCGTLEDQAIYLNVQNWCGFSFYFLFPFFLFRYAYSFLFWYLEYLYLYIFLYFYFWIIVRYWIIGQPTLQYIFLGLFWLFCRWGLGINCILPSHTLYSLHECGSIPESVLLKIKGDCVVVPRWMYYCENPN